MPVLKFLIKQGMDVNVRDQERYTALHYAAENNHVDAIEVLLGSGADPDVTDRFKKVHVLVPLPVPLPVVMPGQDLWPIRPPILPNTSK